MESPPPHDSARCWATLLYHYRVRGTVPLASSRGGRIAGNAGGINVQIKEHLQVAEQMFLNKQIRARVFWRRGPPAAGASPPGPGRTCSLRSSDDFPPRLAVTTTLVSAQAGPTSSMLGFPAWGPACRLNIPGQTHTFRSQCLSLPTLTRTHCHHVLSHLCESRGRGSRDRAPAQSSRQGPLRLVGKATARPAPAGLRLAAVADGPVRRHSHKSQYYWGPWLCGSGCQLPVSVRKAQCEECTGNVIGNHV